MQDNQEALFPLHARATVSTTKNPRNLDNGLSRNRQNSKIFFPPAQGRLAFVPMSIGPKRGRVQLQGRPMSEETLDFLEWKEAFENTPLCRVNDNAHLPRRLKKL
jgi:hypothetical protein